MNQGVAYVRFRPWGPRLLRLRDLKDRILRVLKSRVPGSIVFCPESPAGNSATLWSNSESKDRFHLSVIQSECLWIIRGLGISRERKRFRDDTMLPDHQSAAGRGSLAESLNQPPRSAEPSFGSPRGKELRRRDAGYDFDNLQGSLTIEQHNDRVKTESLP